MNSLRVLTMYVRTSTTFKKITKGSFKAHLKQLDTLLEKIEMAGLKINATKSCFATHELEYLGYWISQDGIQTLASKVKAIKNGQTPK